MASGDTKTQQYLDVAANGTRADLPAETCCETRTQSLIRGVAERIMDVEDEVERLENNPDVVDIVDTYADLQDYPTSGLTNKDVIRVITDETKGGLSSYYRWNSPNSGWNFIGVIPGGDGIKELSSADYNYPTGDPDRVALWLLDNGLYTAPAGVMVAASTTSYPWYNTSDKTILVGGSDAVKGIYTFLNGKTDVVTTQVSDGTEADEYTLLKSTQVLQATGQSTTDTMSQKAVTDALASAGPTVVQTTGTSTTDVMSQNATSRMVYDDPATKIRVSIGSTLPNSYVGSYSTRIGGDANAQADRSVAIGVGAAAEMGVGSVAVGYLAKATTKGQFDISTMNGPAANTYGYNNSQYRLLTGLYDPQSAHDAANKEYVDNLAISYAALNGVSAPTTATAGEYVGQLYLDTTNDQMYYLASIDDTADPVEYNWETIGGSNINVVQTTGASTTDVMSQNAVTSMIFSANSNDSNKTGIKIEKSGILDSKSVRIGYGNIVYGSGISIGWGKSGNNNASSGNVTIRGGNSGGSDMGARAQYDAIAIGNGNTDVRGNYSMAIGGSATVANSITYAIALGSGSNATMKGQMQIGLSDGSTNGYNNSQYRLLTGLYDPQSDHDAATKGYVDTAVASAGGAEEITSEDWSALWQ